jgi:hypothetical protein
VENDDGCSTVSCSWYWKSLTEPSAKAAASSGDLGCQQRSNIPGRSSELWWWRRREEEEEEEEEEGGMMSVEEAPRREDCCWVSSCWFCSL